MNALAVLSVVNRMVASNGRMVFLLFVALLCANSRSQNAPASAQEHSNAPVFHAQTQLVLVDVIARDLKTGLPLQDLTR